MDKATGEAGYESVSHSDEAVGRFPDFKSYDQQRADEGGAMLSEKPTEDFEISSGTEHERTFWQRCNAFWVWELITTLVSMGCLGVVIWALLRLDDNPLSDWPIPRWTPASFLSTFVTMSRFMMLVGVAEAIGQLRWLYYLGGSHRLDHLDSFESASRGPWGSLLFLLRVSIQGVAPSIARLGAVVMLVALAMDPLTQQILEYPTRAQDLVDTDTWVLATYNPDSHQGGVFSDDARRQSIYGGVLGFPPPVTYDCFSGNCSWPPFASLGYDIPCRDVASLAIKECVAGSGILNQNCSSILHTVPSLNLSLVLQNGSVAVGDTSNETRVITLLSSNLTDPIPAGPKSPLIFSFIMAQLLADRVNGSFVTSDLQNPSWNITACDAKWSGIIYEDQKVVKGVFQSGTSHPFDLVPLETSSCWTNQSCQEFIPSDPSAVPGGLNASYSITADPTPASVRNLLSFNYNVTARGPNLESDDGTSGAYSLGSGLFWNVNLTTVFQNTAETITYFLRQQDNPVKIYGTQTVWTTYVNVRWRYFALPAAANLLGPIFLCCVIAYTAIGVKGERLIWKTNTIPLLMHGLQGYHRHGYAGAETTDAIFRKARKMNVQLRRNDDGEIRFVRTDQQLVQ